MESSVKKRQSYIRFGSILISMTYKNNASYIHPVEQTDCFGISHYFVLLWSTFISVISFSSTGLLTMDMVVRVKYLPLPKSNSVVLINVTVTTAKSS